MRSRGPKSHLATATGVMMFFNDQFYQQKLVELTRDPTLIEARIWIGVALATQNDPRGAKLLTENFDLTSEFTCCELRTQPVD